jgi:polysaccharide deacetylase family protein (PEP-CTERM system associated)
LQRFLITIDVEDWFQVENLRPWNPVSAWDRRELRVEANVHKLLDLFDSVNRAPAASQPNPVNPVGSNSFFIFNPTNPTNLPFRAPCTVRRAPSSSVSSTFFVLGWLAERLPHLVREITARGHEVGSHGMSHRMCSRLSEAELRSELSGSKQLLEDITGAEVAGFRAPNFSVDDRVLSILQSCGYRYDSSYNSFSLHGRYGRISLNGQPRAGIASKLSENFFELPVSNFSVSPFSTLGTSGILAHFRHFTLPWSGGAYFRLLPFRFFRYGVRKILERQGAYLFYAHPWEFDPGQPRVEEASRFARFKHYTNIEAAAAKLARLIRSFSGCDFMTCREYLGSLGHTGSPQKQKTPHRIDAESAEGQGFVNLSAYLR